MPLKKSFQAITWKILYDEFEKKIDIKLFSNDPAQYPHVLIKYEQYFPYLPNFENAVGSRDRTCY